MSGCASDVIADGDYLYAEAKYLEALREYAYIRTTMSGLPPGEVAAKRIAAANKDPAAKTAIQEVEAQVAYEPIGRIVDAQWKKMCPSKRKADAPEPKRPSDAELVAKMSFARRAELFRRLERFAQDHGNGTPTGKKGQAILKQLRADKEFVAALAARKAEKVVQQRFEQCRRYETAKLYKKAAECYRDFLVKYPDSEYAGQARKRLEAMQKRDK